MRLHPSLLDWPEQRLRWMLAHELGHLHVQRVEVLRRQDTRYRIAQYVAGVVIVVVGAVAGFGLLAGFYALALVGLAILLCVLFGGLGVVGRLSRPLEYAADEFAAELVGAESGQEHFATRMRERPQRRGVVARWTATHPTDAERLEALA